MSADTQTPIQDSLDGIGKNGDGFDLTLAHETEGGTSVGVDVFRDIGKPGGWSLGGAAQWIKDKGGRVLGKLTWRPADIRKP